MTSMAGAYDQAKTFCPHCGTPNASGARFCASCGKSMGGDAPSSASGASPHALPPTAPGPLAAVLGHQATATVDGDAAAVLAHARQVIMRRNGTVEGQTTGNLSGRARTLFILNLFIPAWFDVAVTTSPAGGNRTQVSSSATLNLAASVPLLVLIAAGVLLGLAGTANGQSIIWLPINLAISVGVQKLLAYWLANELLKVRPGFVAEPAAPELRAAAAPPAPIASDPYADLERLAKLRDMGAITIEEFERKKVEILGKI